MFLSAQDRQLGDDYLQRGYVIRPVADRAALDWMRERFIKLVADTISDVSDSDVDDLLNGIHRHVPVAQLNAFRLRIIQGINATEGFRERYYRVAQPYLDTIVGNELAMQLRVNLSIQYPNDDSSLLPVHADTWSGDSPFETVVWLPLVDCYGTKAMYLLPPTQIAEFDARMAGGHDASSEAVYQAIANHVEWLEVRYGEVLVFNQALPHGNRINQETETRWSMNCRFKGVFTPYGDKKLGEFFEPITLRAASRAGIDYRLPALP